MRPRFEKTYPRIRVHQATDPDKAGQWFAIPLIDTDKPSYPGAYGPTPKAAVDQIKPRLQEATA